MELETINETKTYYTESVKKALYKYRMKNQDKYNESQRLYYEKMKINPEWKKKFNERSKINNKKYRDKKNTGLEPKKRGRPRKEIKINIEEITIENN